MSDTNDTAQPDLEQIRADLLANSRSYRAFGTEISVPLTVDVVLSDAGPIKRIIQALGELHGTVNVLTDLEHRYGSAVLRVRVWEPEAKLRAQWEELCAPTPEPLPVVEQVDSPAGETAQVPASMIDGVS